MKVVMEVTEAAPEGAAATVSGTLRTERSQCQVARYKGSNCGCASCKRKPSGGPSSGSGSETSGEEECPRGLQPSSCRGV